MAKVKVFNAAALRNELVKQTGWDFTFRHKYTGDAIGIIHAWCWSPLDKSSPFVWPDWQKRSKWSSAQTKAFQDKLEKEKERIANLCGPIVLQWMQVYHPELATSVRVKDTTIFIEAVNASIFGIVQQPVVQQPDNDEELSNLLKQI
jgi:hypothetical protein